MYNVNRKVVYNMARESRRININFPVDLLQRLDDYAESMSINRTAATCVLVSQALDNKKAMSDISELVKIAQAQELK